MNQHTLLEEEQKQLLELLVEASRNVKRENRQEFIIIEIAGSRSKVDHPGLPIGGVEAYMGDIKILAREGLIALSYVQRGVHSFDVISSGFKYYEDMKLSQNQPVQRVENAVKQFLNANNFRRKYSKVYLNWARAETLLWSSDSQSQLTTIGYLCHEALQDFAAILVKKHRPPNVDTDKANTVARIRAVLNQRCDQLGRTESPFLEALLVYWGTVSDLVQRQKHGGKKEGEPLIWEDGRRVVFQTAILIMEIDSALSKVT